MERNSQTEGWRRHLANNGRKVEERLGAAQAAHRLAIHCFEYDDANRVYPFQTLHDLSSNIPVFEQASAASVGDNQLATLSTTLLAAPGSGKYVRPCYLSQHGEDETAGYLFDLSELKPDPARVARVFLKQPYTDRDNFNKKLGLDFHRTPELATLFTEEYRHACPAGYDATARGAYMTDVMRNPAKYAAKLDDLAATFSKSPSNSLPWNEVLVAAMPKHISAIVVPLASFMSTNKGLGTTQARLRGALAGLAHLKNGMDLPVVSYDATQEGGGRIRYLAQGQQELKALAFEAINDLQQNPAFFEQVKGSLYSAAQDCLGVDIYKPLKEQAVDPASQGRGA